MNKGTAIVGFLLSFLAGSGLTWGVSRSAERADAPHVAADDAATSHQSSPIPVGARDPSWGKSDAPVTIVEFSDFECPYCTRVKPTLKSIQQKYGPDQVRIVWKNNPLPSHPRARVAAETAATVHGLGGDFWKFHDLVFDHQKEISPERLEGWAIESGVKPDDLEAALQSKRFTAKVDEDLALTRRLGVTGTPFFKINGRTLNGAQPLAKFEEVIDAELSAARALGESGVPRARLSLMRTQKNFGAPSQQPPRPSPSKDTPKPAEDTQIWKVPVSDRDPSKGPADALVTIVELSDFQCPYCSRVLPTLDQLLAKYAGDVRLVWKDCPMAFHRHARAAANLARVAFAERGAEGFWSAHDALFASQANLQDAGLEQIAKQLGLNLGRVQNAIRTDEFAGLLEHGLSLMQDFGVSGTPAFFINGRKLVGAYPKERFESVIDEQLAAARALTERGVPRARVYRELMKTARPAPEPETKQVEAPTRDNPQRGPADARVTINLFSDFQCPYCNRIEPTLAQLLAEYPRDVRLVWRDLPMSFHPDAALAAEAAREAFVQKGNAGFWKYHDVLFQNQKALGRADLERHAAEVGLDLPAFRAALDARVHRAAVERDVAVARRAGIAATPGVTVDRYFVSGALPLAAYDKLVQRALGKSR